MSRPNCEMTRELTEAILAEVPEAEVEAVEGDEGEGGEREKYLHDVFGFSDTFEVEINGKLIFSKRQLGHYPERDEIVEITKWGNKVEKNSPYKKILTANFCLLVG